MSSSFLTNPGTNPELKSLYEISLLSPPVPFQEYFNGTMTILSRYFPVGYAVILLQDPRKNSLYVEALYGMERSDHPHLGTCDQGIIGQVLQSRQPLPIQDVSQEPFYEEALKNSRPPNKIQSPLLCIPLAIESEPTGIMNISPLYGPREDFSEDFHFLTILSAILSPKINQDHLSKPDPSEGSKKTKKPSLLEEILEERLTEVLKKIDPYVEQKNKTGLLDDIISLVEKILIQSAMEKVGHVQTAAAQLLGINRNTLRTKMKALKIKSR